MKTPLSDVMVERAIQWLRRANEMIAVVAGLCLFAMALIILADIVLRQVAESFGGTDEISGYVMAGVTSWSMGYALTKLAHVRIDLVRTKLKPLGQAIMDCFSLWVLAATALYIAWRGWPVLARSLDLGSRANTPLGTPLWIPQMVWWSGWAWFALSASMLALAILYFSVRKQFDKTDQIGGARSEL